MSEACLSVLTCLQAHTGRASIARWGLRALTRLLVTASHEERKALQLELGKAGACQTVVGAMKDHANNAEVQQSGAVSIGLLAVDDAANSKALADEGAFEVIASALRKFTVDRILRSAAAVTIAALATFSENEGAIAASNALGIVVELLSDNIDQPPIVLAILTAIGGLARQHGVHFSAVGACEAVVQALNAYADDLDVQRSCVQALSMLPGNEEVNSRLCAADPGPGVIRAMRSFPADANIQLHGIVIVTKLEIGRNAYSRHLLDLGSCELVVAALNQCMHSPLRITVALSALCVLICHSGYCDNLGPTCATAVEAVDAYPDHDLVAKNGLSAIRHLSSSSAANCALLLRCGALETVAAAARRYPQSAQLLSNADDVIAKLKSVQ
ncbi:armadillo-type protein [Tribonema minus]|uniref:Armadillo-type protein n=1 Tax=Tribonema minus TaxID=303371 RepID=A0A835Z0S5_9STRA|nr:armadillo-type protein [Tribonema minus]